MSPDTMMAAVYYGPRDVRVERRPLPRLEQGDVLVRVHSAGICGTDLRIWRGEHRHYHAGVQRIPGHEVAGEISGIGDVPPGFAAGDRVLIAPNIGCGRCALCVSGHNNLCPDFDAIGITLDGAFAEYVRVPAAAVNQGNLIPLPPNLDSDAAAMVEPLACALRGQDIVHLHAGDSVLVIGDGPLGLMHVLLARLQGAAPILLSGHRPDRLALGERAGADRVANSHTSDLAAFVADATGRRGVDVVLFAAPAAHEMQQALNLLAVRGRVNYFAGLPAAQSRLELDANLIHYRELCVTGTTACSTDDCRRAAQLVATGRVDLALLAGAAFSLADAAEAFVAAAERKSPKVLIHP